MAPLPGKVLLHCEYISRSCACHIEYEIAEEAMNFSYVAEFSREWGEPNARDMGRMTSQPKAKGEIYILSDDMDMKAKIAAMERRLEELEMNQMQEVQAISQTPLQAMLCAICQSFEHLVEECPIIPVARDMFGDCNTYNSIWRNHPNFSWKPRPPPYQSQAQTQAPQQTSSVEQAIVNLSKVMGDFVVQNDLSQKIDNLQDSISRFANLNTMQEKENSPSQPHQNQKGIHEMEAKEGDKEVDLPTCKLEHNEESETEKEKREEIKGKKNGKSTEEDGYDVNVQGAPQRTVIKEEMMKNHIPPPFPQALYGKIIQSKSQVRDANFVWDPGGIQHEVGVYDACKNRNGGEIEETGEPKCISKALSGISHHEHTQCEFFAQ
ncbi:hypothetical protein CK203_049039 [Vitis vinifera]|uniref:Retrotransposon gag domain-containing protein n=1 Tax=Vitis vinifera TaxID=29760 RepID=A0A438HD90_VITVI|nr:hypothetical protein CK203_049039 [Vitis vinifera]